MTRTLLTEKDDNLSPNKNQGELWVVNYPKRAFWVVNNPQKLPRDIRVENTLSIERDPFSLDRK
jgi:hypothetical protein